MAQQNIVQLKITLLHTDPLVWRCVHVPERFSLRRVHNTIQAVMGWWDSHLHEFEVADKAYGMSEHDEGDIEFRPLYNDRNLRLDQIIKRGITKFTYLYDFGDNWIHEIVIDGTKPPAQNIEYPILIDGDGHGPPEDCGGVHGFEEFKDIMNNKADPEHTSLAEWFGEDEFDPYFVDRKKIEEELERIRSSRRGKG